MINNIIHRSEGIYIAVCRPLLPGSILLWIPAKAESPDRSKDDLIPVAVLQQLSNRLLRNAAPGSCTQGSKLL